MDSNNLNIAPVIEALLKIGWTEDLILTQVADGFSAAAKTMPQLNGIATKLYYYRNELRKGFKDA